MIEFNKEIVKNRIKEMYPTITTTGTFIEEIDVRSGAYFTQKVYKHKETGNMFILDKVLLDGEDVFVLGKESFTYDDRVYREKRYLLDNLATEFEGVISNGKR